MTARVIQLLRKLSKITGLVVLGALLAFLGMRIVQSQRGDPLQLWHTFAPDELSQKELTQIDWAAYLKHESKIMDEVREKVTMQLPDEVRVPGNRYYEESPIYPGKFATDWNRSYVLMPDGPPVGAVVLLHGLTDSPYSLRHVASLYRDRGFAAVAIRLPGHGTVPAGLANIDWEDWSEATRLAVREAVRLSGPERPLHLVGFSNGGALAMKHALDALEDPSLVKPTRMVFFSPMIGITDLARFAGVAGWPAIFPRFAKSAWLGIVPEFNPFKYNSFPVNGARQSSLLTRSLQPRLARYAREGRLGELPPILTFQSVVDFTTSTRAVIESLYANLPKNGSELVLFDLNRSASFGPLMRSAAETTLTRVLPPAPRPYAVSLVTNASNLTHETVELFTAPGETEARKRDLGLAFPPGVFSLSHVALPFPIDDPLYGIEPPEGREYGVSLGAISPRGERGTLIVTLDSLIRMSCNPFFPFVQEKMESVLPDGGQ